MSDFAEIWSTLSQVDLSQHIKKIKAGSRQLSYLSWSDAWEVLMTYYPNSTFEVLPSKSFEDATVEVWVSVTINDHKRVMWLPVMDHRNNSIPTPSSRAVSDARMRCLVKCLSLFGLGLYIYQGEDLPRPKPVDMEAIKAAAVSILSYIHGEFTDDEKYSSIKEIFGEMSEDEKSAIWVAKSNGGFFTQQEKAVIRTAASYTS